MAGRTAAKILSWINWLSFAFLGGYTTYYYIKHYVDFTHVIIAVYLTIFGVVGLCTEFGLEWAMDKFKFLTTYGSKGTFIIFLGTFALSYGFHTDPAEKIIPFIVGCFGCFTGIFLWMVSCSSKGEEGSYIIPKEFAKPNQI